MCLHRIFSRTAAESPINCQVMRNNCLPVRLGFENATAVAFLNMQSDRRVKCFRPLQPLDIHLTITKWIDLKTLHVVGHKWKYIRLHRKIYVPRMRASNHQSISLLDRIPRRRCALSNQASGPDKTSKLLRAALQLFRPPGYRFFQERPTLTVHELRVQSPQARSRPHWRSHMLWPTGLRSSRWDRCPVRQTYKSD